MIDLLAYIALNCVRVLLGHAYILVLLGVVFGYERRKGSLPYIASAIIAVGLFVLEFISGTPENAYNIADDIYTPTMLFLPYIIFKPKKKLTFCLFSLAVSGLTEYLWFAVFSVMRGRNASLPEYSLSSVISFCAIYAAVVVAALILSKRRSGALRSDFPDELSPWIYICLFISQFSVYYELEATDMSPNYPLYSSVLKLLSIGLIVGSIIYAVSRYTKISLKQKEAETLLETELRHYEATIQKNQDIRRFRHDYRNNLFSIGALINGGKPTEALEYINELSEKLDSTRNSYNTGNYLADAILSDKAANAEKLGIKLLFFGTFPSEGIKNSDVCTILSNALDNAVRACTDISPCTVKVTSQVKRTGAIITVENPVAKRVEIKNNSVKTSKADKENHGFGVDNIKRTARKYGGNVTLSCDDRTFKLEITLLFNK